MDTQVETKKVKFLIDQVGFSIGAVKKGEIKEYDKYLADILIKRGICELFEEKPKAKKVKNE